MNAARLKICGSNYLGLFCIANDKVAFVPESIDDRAIKTIETTLDVKTIKTSVYDSQLLSVFAKMNNKILIAPHLLKPRELETIEREIKTKVIKTEQALGNLIEMNDNAIIVSKVVSQKLLDDLTKEKIKYYQTNIGKTDAVGSAICATNNGFVISNTATIEEIKNITTALGVEGGSSTANTGDSLIRNSIVANTKGFIAGEATTGFELNRIDEALSIK